MSNNGTDLKNLLQKIKILIENSKYNTALKELNKILKEDPYSIEALLMKADMYYGQGYLKDSLAIYENVRSIYKSEYPDEIKSIEYFHILKKIAKVHKVLENISQSITYYKELLQMYKLLKDKMDKDLDSEEKEYLLNELGGLYTKLEKYEKALNYYQKLLKVHNKHGDNEAYADDAIAIGNIFTMQQQYNKAKKYYNQALNYYENSEDKGMQGVLYYYLGDISYKQGDNNKALNHLESALMRFEKVNLEKNAIDMEKQEYYKNALNLWKNLKKKSQ
jgi:tetratricopeptide (TPR) repeat protein